jgi:MinD-like ATPase involved in chromosome partitioning or flagellar assembly
MPTGTVITFYSYKGGVGRTFLLANVAAALAGWGYKVLCIDWDLEAPGLVDYLQPWMPPYEKGLLDLIEMIGGQQVPNWRSTIAAVELPNSGKLAVIPAGYQDESYVGRVQGLNWEELYAKRGLGTVLERLRAQWVAEYDFVLLDSRTGISDIGGICTVQLPDILAFMFTANHQSLNGAVDIVNRAERARNHLPYDRSRLLALPIPSRFESREEYDLANKWQQTFVNTLQPFYRNWAEKESKIRELVERTTIPYYSYWSFGERLPIVEEPTRGPDFISYHLETTAALVAHRLARSQLLVENRDSYVGAASRQGLRAGGYGYDVFLSYSRSDKVATATARELATLLMDSGIRVWYDDVNLAPGVDLTEELDRAISQSQHMVAVLGQQQSDWASREIVRFMRQALEDESERTVIPVLVNASPDVLPPLLSRTKYLCIEGSGQKRAEETAAVAREIVSSLQETQGRPPAALPRSAPTQVGSVVKLSIWRRIAAWFRSVFHS